MKAITLKQPWASLVASGLKQVENRTWAVPRSIRGERIAIHAGKGFDSMWWSAFFDLCQCKPAHPSLPDHGKKGDCLVCEVGKYITHYIQDSQAVSGRIICTARIIGQCLDGGKPEWFSRGPCVHCGGSGWVHTGSVDYAEDCLDCRGTGNFYANFDPSFIETSDYCWSCSGVGEHLHCGVAGRDSITCISCRGTGQTKRIYNWILADVELVSDHTIYRGKLGIWELPADALKEAA